MLSDFAKSNNITIFVIWHVTTWWDIAGPKYLEHIVDVVLYLEWERNGELRFLRAYKNRFGRSDETAIFQMSVQWLQPVYDLQERIASLSQSNVPWAVLSVGLDNGRPVLAHLESLLSKTYGKFPQRRVVGCSSQKSRSSLCNLTEVLEMYHVSLWCIYQRARWVLFFGQLIRSCDCCFYVRTVQKYRYQYIVCVCRRNLIVMTGNGSKSTRKKKKIYSWMTRMYRSFQN